MNTILLSSLLASSISTTVLPNDGFFLEPPIGSIEYASLDSIPRNFDEYGFGDYVNEHKNFIIYNSSKYYDQSYRVLKLNKVFCISYETEKIFHDIASYNIPTRLSHTYGKNITTFNTYEQTIRSSNAISVEAKLSSDILKFDLLTAEFGANISSSLSTEVKNTTKIEENKFESYTVEYTINTPGYYQFQKRALFNCYVIQDAITLMNNKLNAEKYYLVKNYLHFQYINNTDMVGCYKYNFENNRFVLDKNTSHDSDIIYV